MASWAIIIGIDHYELPRLRLKGAVRDAIEMYRWVTGEGGVETDNVLLLLARSSDSPDALAGSEELPARQRDIVKAVKELANKPAGPKDRLCFYFSGHGLTESFGGGHALLPAEFNEDESAGVSLDLVLQFLKTSQFNWQFIFIDACRNFAFEHNAG